MTRHSFLAFVAILSAVPSLGATYTVSLRASRGYFVSAIGGGGGDLRANRSGVGQWETFEMFDRNGGKLMSKDTICLETYRRYYVVAENGGGNTVRANRSSCGEWERFQIIKVNSQGWPVTGEISFPSRVAFRSANGSYLTAESGGSLEGGMNANRPAIGPWEIFRIALR